MKKQFTLSVSSPCSEQWDTFLPVKNGGFCSSCRQTVVDFSNMSEWEIVRFFEEKPSNICGRFRNDQLRTYYPQSVSTINPSWHLLKVGLLGLSLLLAGHTVSAVIPPEGNAIEIVENEVVSRPDPTQDSQTISGIVKDENNEPMAGVNIYFQNSYTGTVSDVNGNFQLTGSFNSGDKIIFSFLGYEPVEYTVVENTPPFLEIALTEYHVLMGKVQVDAPYEEKESSINQFWQKVKTIF